MWIYCANDRIRGGIPDVLSIKDGVMIALELKFFRGDFSKKISLSHPLTASQSKSLREIGKSGGVSAVLILLKDGSVSVHTHEDISPGVTKSLPPNIFSMRELTSWLKNQIYMRKMGGST